MIATAIFLSMSVSLFAAERADASAADDAEATTSKSDKDWQVERPESVTRSIDIDVTEGTWMSLDVSPDGKSIAFDLLGDIYEIPIEGGEARSLSAGMAWEMQPRYSPDGSAIAFISDREGGDNIWLHLPSCLLYTSPSPRDRQKSRMPSSA